MRLYVIRHAIAEDPAPDLADTQRELTKDGRRKMKNVVKGLRELDIRFERLLTSPWLRAVQTTELVAPLCSTSPFTTDLLCQPPCAELLASIASPGFAGGRSPAEGRGGGSIASPGFAGGRSPAEGRGGELIAEPNETTAIVGHEPWLSELIAWLAFGDTRHGEQLDLKKGGVAILEGSAVPGGMQLHALLLPSMLRALA